MTLKLSLTLELPCGIIQSDLILAIFFNEKNYKIALMPPFTKCGLSFIALKNTRDIKNFNLYNKTTKMPHSEQNHSYFNISKMADHIWKWQHYDYSVIIVS